MVKLKSQAKATSSRRTQNSSAIKQAVTSSVLSTTQANVVGLAATIPSCCGCGTLISDDTKALQCDKCQTEAWKCIDCLSISGDVYDQLLQQPSCELKWYCENCDKAITDSSSACRIDKLLSVVEKLVDKFADVEDKLQAKSDRSDMVQLDTRIKNLEHKFLHYEQNIDLKLAAVDANVSKFVEEKLRGLEEMRNDHQSTSAVEQAVKEEVIKKMDEDKDIESRQNNMIVYKVPERQSDSLEDRKESDQNFIKDLMHTVFEITLNDDSIEKMFRLGKLTNTAESVWPLLVRFKKIEDKNMVMNNLRQLRQAEARFKGVGISHDFTPKQREERKRLIASAKRDHEDNSDESVENFHFLVVGSGIRTRVIKVKKHQ